MGEPMGILHALWESDAEWGDSRDREEESGPFEVGEEGELFVPLPEMPLGGVCDDGSCGSIGGEMDPGPWEPPYDVQFSRGLDADQGSVPESTTEDYSGRATAGCKEKKTPRPHIDHVLWALGGGGEKPQVEGPSDIKGATAEGWLEEHARRCKNHYRVVWFADRYGHDYPKTVRILHQSGQWLKHGPVPWGWHYPPSMSTRESPILAVFMEYCDMLRKDDEDKHLNEKDVILAWIRRRRSTKTGYSAAEIASKVKLDPVLTACLLEEIAFLGGIKKGESGRYSHVLSEAK